MPDPGRALSPEERDNYVKRDCGRCPYCQSHDIVGDSLEVDGNQVTQGVSCSECERSWTDVYTLTGIEETP